MRDIDGGEPLGRRVYAQIAERYARLVETKPHHALCERPATLSLLGEVTGRLVLDAGCGPGITSEMLARRGARVHAFDVTPAMVAFTQKRCAGLAVEVQIADLAAPLDWLGDSLFDCVLCELALDYVQELRPTLREFRRVCRCDGRLVFSISHPMQSWLEQSADMEASYFETRRIITEWKSFGEPRLTVEAYRRPLRAILNSLVHSGWALEQVLEPEPLPAMQSIAPELYGRLRRAPSFLCIRARPSARRRIPRTTRRVT